MKSKILASALILSTISGCSLLQKPPREVEIITKPVEIVITQPIKIANKDGLYPEGYTYFDKFIDDIKNIHGGDLVFVAMSVADYELMSYNTQELKRYLSQLGEVIIYYKEVTTPKKVSSEK